MYAGIVVKMRDMRPIIASIVVQFVKTVGRLMVVAQLRRRKMEMMSELSYPVDWEVIAWNVKSEAGWACEHCGREHNVRDGYCLTVHHLDGRPPNCLYTNLVALCQRCHLRIQARFFPGQLWLFDPPSWARKRGLHEFI